MFCMIYSEVRSFLPMHYFFLLMCKNGAMVGRIEIDKLTDMQKSELSFRISQALDILDNEPSAISDVEKH